MHHDKILLELKEKLICEDAIFVHPVGLVGRPLTLGARSEETPPQPAAQAGRPRHTLLVKEWIRRAGAASRPARLPSTAAYFAAAGMSGLFLASFTCKSSTAKFNRLHSDELHLKLKEKLMCEDAIFA